MPFGLFDLVVSQLTEDRLVAIDPDKVAIDSVPANAADSHATLADYLRSLLRRALDALSGEERVEQQTALCNQVVRLLTELAGEDFAGEVIAGRARRLLSIRPATHNALPDSTFLRT